MIPRTFIAAFVAAAAMSPASALAGEGPPGPNGQLNVIGLEVQSVDDAARTVTGIQHCVPPEVAGRVQTFKAGLQDFSPQQFPVGQIVGIEVDWAGQPPIITRFGPAPCDVKPGVVSGGPGGNLQPPWPAGDGKGAPGGGPNNAGGGAPKLASSFTSRVWKLEGEADGFSDGVLSMTLGKVLNLPKRMAQQDDELVDEDAAVLVAQSARVYDGKKAVAQRAEAGVLADAENVRVQGKILPVSKWRKDADGEAVTTIRAKKIYVLS